LDVQQLLKRIGQLLAEGQGLAMYREGHDHPGDEVQALFAGALSVRLARGPSYPLWVENRT
jgi:1-acyl-sn-glycerol-3-phosphate acyltransferase